MNSFLFKGAYSLDIKWATKGEIKTFQALEFKQSDIVLDINGITYHPVRYMHAEYDLTNNLFRHFDGAVHLYLAHEYFDRRDKDFNVGFKSPTEYKAASVKLFKFNGELSVDFWTKFCGHFLAGNPLMYEYFSGQYPDQLIDTINRLRTREHSSR